MNYATHAAQVANEARANRDARWIKHTVGKRTFQRKSDCPGYPIQKTIYCVTGLSQSKQYSITDRTSGLIIHCDTIEHARIEFRKVQQWMLKHGWEKVMD